MHNIFAYMIFFQQTHNISGKEWARPECANWIDFAIRNSAKLPLHYNYLLWIWSAGLNLCYRTGSRTSWLQRRRCGLPPGPQRRWVCRLHSHLRWPLRLLWPPLWPWLLPQPRPTRPARLLVLPLSRCVLFNCVQSLCATGWFYFWYDLQVLENVKRFHYYYSVFSWDLNSKPLVYLPPNHSK